MTRRAGRNCPSRGCGPSAGSWPVRAAVPGPAVASGLARALMLSLLLSLMPGLVPSLIPAIGTGQVQAEVVTAPPQGSAAGVTSDANGTIQRPETAAGGAAAGLSLGKASTLPTIGKTKIANGGPDYAAWERMAQRAEAALAAGDQSAAPTLERLRAQLADWREALLGAENANAARIETLRQQIAALGPAPQAGVTEAEEIARRRVELSDQLVQLQAPGIAAEEAYRRADGLIAEIDRVLRERQADALLKLWPSPVNPDNWGQGVAALTTIATTLWSETARRIGDEGTRRALANKAPLVLAYLAAALAILARGRRWLAWGLGRLSGPAGERAQRIWDFLASIGMIIVPVLGLMALSQALTQSGLFGPAGMALAGDLGRLGFMAASAIWLGERAFPEAEGAGLGLRVSSDERGQLRALTTAFGLLMVAARVRRLLNEQLDLSDAANSLLNFPIALIGGVLLWRIGRLLARHRVEMVGSGDDAGVNTRDRSVTVLGRVVVLIGLVAPVLAAVGYNVASQSLIFPAARSLALMGLLVLVQRFLADVVALVSRKDGETEGLVPVLIGFALTVAALPAFALIWGARVSDMTELWTRFQEGFQLGQARISPTDFLIFAVIFGIGFTLTRLLQGVLKSSVLPRTSLDQGGQNAIVSGLGYLGIFVSALVAIDSTGIDLSGLAIVAGALSVGIGFGLQTIVSNFVSGVILLIERPVSEGDWIEVGPVTGIVKAISVRSTRIQTFDRSDVIVPNSDLITGRVTNWTRFNQTGRLIVPVQVPFTVDSRKVERILHEIAEAQPLVLLSPPPAVGFMGFGPEVMNFEIRVILRDVKFQFDVRSEINHMIARRFAEEGIPHSSAHLDHLLKEAEGPELKAAALAEQRERDALLAALMGADVAARVKAAREGGEEGVA